MQHGCMAVNVFNHAFVGGKEATTNRTMVPTGRSGKWIVNIVPCRNWASSSQALYMRADEEECRKSVADAPEDLRAVFLDMHKAKRATCPRPNVAAEVYQMPRCETQVALSQWK